MEITARQFVGGRTFSLAVHGATTLGLMNTQNQTDDLPVKRIDRILAFSSVVLIGLSILCFIAIIVATAVHADFGVPIWGVIFTFINVALPVGVLLFFVLLIMNLVRRSRAAKQSRKG